jgi:hypothetical protein
MDNKIFLISYLGGMHGEFLGSILSNDENFYSADSISLENNKYSYIDCLQKNGIHIKLSFNNFNYQDNNVKLLSDYQKSIIENRYSTKNLCVLTHIWEQNLTMFNLPNLNPVRLYCKGDYIFFTFLMAIIKSWILPFSLSEEDKNFFLSKRNEINKNYIELILNRNEYYWVERLALSKNLFNLESLIDHYYYKIYSHSNALAVNKTFQNWNYFDIENFIIDPKNNSSNFKTTFNLINDVDLDLVNNYHLTNLKVIEKNLNLNYVQILNSSNKFNLLKEFILTKLENSNFF